MSGASTVVEEKRARPERTKASPSQGAPLRPEILRTQSGRSGAASVQGPTTASAAPVTAARVAPATPAPAPQSHAEVMALHSTYGNAAVAHAALPRQPAPVHVPAAHGAVKHEEKASAQHEPPAIAHAQGPAAAGPAQQSAAGPAAGGADHGAHAASAQAHAPAAVTAHGLAAGGGAPARGHAAASAGASKAPMEKRETEPGDAKSAKSVGSNGADAASSQKRRAASPLADHAFVAVVHHIKGAAQQQKAHGSARGQAAAAHAAAMSPPNEVSSAAAAKQTEVIDRQQPKPFNRNAFKQALLQKIKDTAPKTLKEADDFKSNNKLGAVKADLGSEVAKEKKESQGPLADKLAEKPDTSGIEPKPTTPLPPPETGAASGVAAAGAAPKPASDAEVSLQAGPQELKQQMQDAKVTEEQLQNSNEPAFQSALGQKKEAEQQSATAPQEYRKEEAGIITSAQAEAQSSASSHVAQMHGARAAALGGVMGHQTAAKAEEEKQRAKIASDIEKMYDKTKTEVEACLQKLDKDVNDTFDAGAAAAQKAFEDYVGDRMFKYKLLRYIGPAGPILWAKDELLGLPDEVDAFYQEGHDLYIEKMDGVIDQVAAMVETGLNEAKAKIAAGKAEIQTYVGGLPTALQDIGKKAAGDIQGKFDALEQSVTAKQDQLVEGLAKKYTDNLQKVDDRIAQMKEENKGLVSKAADALKGVIQTIIDLKNMLLNVFSRAADAIDLVIAHPIEFLGHLVDAGKLGFSNFADHILEHLKQGFMDWLFGAVANIGIQLPEHFDLKGILSLVLQILGLTYSNIRSRAVKILGEKVVKALETAAEIFKILITKGPAGLWEYIKEKIGDLKAMVIDKIKSFVMEKIIVAGITWIIGLLNPASAFVKACKAIYDIVMFFVERGKQILDLVNSIIDSITAIAKGAIGAAAAFVENSLARTIPVIIGFLASLLGVGGISEKIKEIIEAIRKPINEAIDWVIHKAVDLVKAIGGLLGFGKKEEKKDAKKDLGEVQAAAREAVTARFGTGATEEEVEAALPGILAELEPMGLKSLILGPPSEDDSREILAEASPRSRIAKLVKKRVTVAVTAEITVEEGEPILSGLFKGKSFERLPGGGMKEWPGEDPMFAQFHEGQKEALGGTGRAAQLPPVSQPPRTSAKYGDQPSGGLIVEPEKGSRKLEVHAWNTSGRIPKSNVSHAETQFVEWFQSRPLTWLRRVEIVKVRVQGRPICPECSEMMNNFTERMKSIRGDMEVSFQPYDPKEEKDEQVE